MVGLEGVEHLAEAARGRLDLQRLLGLEVVEVLVDRRRRLDLVLDAVEAPRLFLAAWNQILRYLISLPITPQLIQTDLPICIPKCLDPHPIVGTSYPPASPHR